MNASTLQRILDAAERAASSGDYASAESLLREAASLQESTLGPQHPDLASTFNNLGVVCEKRHNVADAEDFYRRAFSIASASLDADHPLVTTSRNNLNDFCRSLASTASGTTTPHLDAETLIRREDSAKTDERSKEAQPPTPAVASDGSGWSSTIVAGAAIFVVLLAALGIWLTRTSPPRSASGKRGPAQEPVSASRAVSSPNPRPAQPAATNKPSEREEPFTDDTPTKTEVATARHADPRVIEASLCHSLSTTGLRWQCTSPSDPAAAGSLYFYTRIAAPKATHVHHRWYRNGQLRQDVDLAVQANPSTGYRTYSRQRVDEGEWRVDVITTDGVVLQQERIAVR
jgi:tetratricopeptide (TPR) repeat protein